MLSISLALGAQAPVVASGPTFAVSVAGLDGGTARIGTQLTASAGSYSDGAPASVAWEWVNATGPGSTTASYTPVAGDDLASIYPRATPSDTYAARNGQAATVRYTAPTASNALPDVAYTTGSGNQTVDASGDFSGGGLSWSVSGMAGVTISGAGVVTIPTGADTTGTVTVTAVNSGGSVQSAFGVTVAAAPPGPALSITVDGEINITGSGDISLTVTAPTEYAGGPYTTDQSTAATGLLNTTAIETGPQCAVLPSIARTSGASDQVGAVYTRVSGLWLYDEDDTGTWALTGEWYLDDTGTGQTGATYTSTAPGAVEWRGAATGAGAARTAISNEITVAAAATAPAQMAAPTVTSTGETSISVDLAAAPANGGSPITSYDLRWQASGGGWTTVTGVSDPDTVSALTAGTLYNVQTRAVNAVGNGAWSASGSATTDAAPVVDPATALINLWGSDLLFLFDLTDKTKLYQTKNLTTPVTAAGQAAVYFEDLSANNNHMEASGPASVTVQDGYVEYDDCMLYTSLETGFTADSGIAILLDPNGDAIWPMGGNLLSSQFVGMAQDGSGAAPDSGFGGTIVHAVENVDLSSPDRNALRDAVAAEGGWAVQTSRGFDLSSGQQYFAPLAYQSAAFRFGGNVKYIVGFKNPTTQKLADQQTILDGAKS